ncbi:MAG TPA: DUF2752 domain-containing protein [Gemmataceae bacterium]|nr:DUF2752 domain-containing protein [Gemmataceae bacterium]
MDGPLNAMPVLGKAVRVGLVLIAVGLVTVFVIAIRLNPYYADGQPRSMETHRELGLPPCSFYEITGLPCPSCGMTTSFSLLMHGDVWNSLKANAVGTGLAVFCLFLIPWCLASAWVSRPLGLWSLERALIRLLIVFLVVLFVRWGIVLGLIWAHGGPKSWHREAEPPVQSRRHDDGRMQATLAAPQPGPGSRLLRCRVQRSDHAVFLVPAPVRRGLETAARDGQADLG